MNKPSIGINSMSKVYDVILFVVAFCLYAPSLRNGFVGDDLIYFIGNKYIAACDVKTILQSGAIGADYAPLRDLSFALDYRLWGANPLGFHLANVLLFAVIVVAVRHLFVELNRYLVGAEGKGGQALSFFATLVVAVHPNHREVVYAVYNRGALLTTFFSVFTLMLFVRSIGGVANRLYWYAGALFCFVGALMSREYCITLPLVLALVLCYDSRNRFRIKCAMVLPFFLTSFLFFKVFRHYAVDGNFIAATTSMMSESLAKASLAVKIVLFYLVRTVTSLGTLDLQGSPQLVVISVAVVAGVLTVAIWHRHKSPQLLFGLIFYLACLIPFLNFYQTFPLVSPRYSFLSCLGLFFTLMALPAAGKARVLPVLCVGATLLWTMMTMEKTDYWKDNVSFWELMAARDQNSFTNKHLGFAYLDAKRYRAACDTLSTAGPLPTDLDFYAAFGESCFQAGNYELAIRASQHVLSMDAANAAASLLLEKSSRAAGI